MNLPSLDEVRRERQRRACENSLLEFARQSWHVFESREFCDSWHLAVIAEHLEAIYRRDIGNLIINIPPGTMKSLMVSVIFPAWIWAKDQTARFLGASYGANLAIRDAQKTRDIITSEWYRGLWPDVAIREGEDQKIKYALTGGGWRIATSVGGAATGEHPNYKICLHPDMLIECETGAVRIGDLVAQRLSVRVASFNHDTGRAQWAPIEEYEQSAGRAACCLHFKGGAPIVMTEDHPVFVVGRGYVPAAEVRRGDVTLRYVREGVLQNASARGSSKGWGLLLTRLQQHWANWRQAPLPAGGEEADRNEVCALREAGGSPRVPHPRDTAGVLRLGMQGSTHARGEPSTSWRTCLEGVRSLWRRDDGLAVPHEEETLLLEDVPRNGEAYRERGGEERALHTREREAELPTSVLPDGSFSSPARSGGVSLVRSKRAEPDVPCAPHRLQQRQQPSSESDIAVPLLPQQDERDRAGAGTLVEDVVLAVEAHPTPEHVFNIRVAGNHNYFANGVLLHNCDDPTNAKQADSDAERETANDWFDRTLTSRGKSLNAQTVVIMQRLHQKDLTGHILAKKLGYEHLCIPMEYDGIKRKTSLGYYDPRTKVGELLWPEMFPAKSVEELKEGLGTYATAGQLAQQPAPDGGGIIDTEAFELWPHDKPLPQFLYVAQGYDTAFTEKTSNDPTAMQAWGVFEHKGKRHVMLLDCWTDHMRYPDLRERVIDEWGATYGKTDHTNMTKTRRADIVLIENKGSGQALVNDLYSANIFVTSYDLPRGQRAELSKVSRVHLITHIIDAGRVWLMESAKNPGQPVTWARNFVAECAVFPKGEHDDQVDVTSMTLYYLKDTGWFDLQMATEEEEEEEAGYTNKRTNPYAA